MPEPSSTTTEPPRRAGGLDRPVEREFTIKERSQFEQAARRFFQHKVAVGSLVVLLILVLFAFVGGALWKYGYNDIPRGCAECNLGPTLNHPFGTDNLGKDLMAQVMRGLQQSIKVALLVALIATVVGSTWGVVAGYLSGFVDSFLMRFADLVLTIPSLALAAAMSGRFKGGWYVIAIILGSLAAPYVSRVMRGVVLSLREREFIEASRALGASNTRIMFRHLVPNALAVVIVNATLLVAGAILAEAALSFFGFGVQAPDVSLGNLVEAGQEAVFTRPWLFYFPGLFIILLALAVNFIGDGLRDALDPRQTRERR